MPGRQHVLSSATVAAGGAVPSQHLLILHGIFGRGRNWTTLARDLTAARPDWAAVLVDLRLHGDSPAFAPPHTVSAAAADLARFEEATRAHAGAVLGHSFGGKVALAHAASARDVLRQVWVVDSTPEARAPDGSSWRMLDAVRSLPTTFAARPEAVSGLVAAGYSPGVAAWMASNLAYRDGRYRWRLDFDAMEQLLLDFFRTDLWAIVEAPPDAMTLHFVRAQDSSVLSEPACRRIEEAGRRHGQVFLHRVPGGHWVHVENPRAVLDLLTVHLPRASRAHSP